ncbi:MAG: hypothetical protein ACRCZI_09495 [Cetobacterium sp.]
MLPVDMTGVIELSNALNGTIPPLQKVVLRSVLGAVGNQLNADTMDELLPQLLIDFPKSKAGLWKGLRAAKDGKYHIWLGAQVWQQTAWLYPAVRDNGIVADIQNLALAMVRPAVAWAASFAEDWNCADSTTIDCDLTWSEFTNTGLQIVSNALTGGVGLGEARITSALDSDDMEAQVTLVSMTRNGTGIISCHVFARKDSTNVRTWYAAHSTLDSSGDNYGLSKRVVSTSTTLGETAGTPTTGIVVTVKVDGDQISSYRNGALAFGPVTDTSISGNTYAGVYSNQTTTPTSSCVMDNFAVSDTAAPSGSSGAVRRRAS